MSDGNNRYLVHKKTSVFGDGDIFKTYQIVAPYTAVDCLKAIICNPYIQMGSGKREAEHDVGFGCGTDYDHYESVDGFLVSGDYECYEGNTYISAYTFFGKYKGKQIEVGFADKGVMTLSCCENDIDLCVVIEEAESMVVPNANHPCLD